MGISDALFRLLAGEAFKVHDFSILLIDCYNLPITARHIVQWRRQSNSSAEPRRHDSTTLALSGGRRGYNKRFPRRRLLGCQPLPKEFADVWSKSMLSWSLQKKNLEMLVTTCTDKLKKKKNIDLLHTTGTGKKLGYKETWNATG